MDILPLIFMNFEDQFQVLGNILWQKTILRFVSDLYFQVLLQRWEPSWAQSNCHWASCYKVFRVSRSQTAFGCLYAGWRLELSLSLSLSLTHWSLLFKLWRCIRVLRPPVCSPFPLLCFWRMPFFLLTYLPVDFCHWPLSPRYCHPDHNPIPGVMQAPPEHSPLEDHKPLFLLLLLIWLLPRISYF